MELTSSCFVALRFGARSAPAFLSTQPFAVELTWQLSIVVLLLFHADPLSHL